MATDPKTGTYSKSSAGKARKAYQVAMRRRAVSLLMEQGLEQKEIARRLGVGEGTVSGDAAAIKQAALAEAVAVWRGQWLGRLWHWMRTRLR